MYRRTSSTNVSSLCSRAPALILAWNGSGQIRAYGRRDKTDARMYLCDHFFSFELPSPPPPYFRLAQARQCDCTLHGRDDYRETSIGSSIGERSNGTA